MDPLEEFHIQDHILIHIFFSDLIIDHLSSPQVEAQVVIQKIHWAVIGKLSVSHNDVLSVASSTVGSLSLIIM